MREMRELQFHKTNECMEHCTIESDEPDPVSGGCHTYRITVNQTAPDGSPKPSFVTDINFQNGPIKEVGINGLTNEALLAIVVDRFEGFQKGKFPSRETAIALTKVQEALHWMNHRTIDRKVRGVEGTLQK
jgi:hypothetical protein